MQKKLFRELIESVKEGGRILRGEIKPARVFDRNEAQTRSFRKIYGNAIETVKKLNGVTCQTTKHMIV